MEEFFDPEIFNIVEEENCYIISTKDGKQCLKLSFNRKTIKVIDLDKCGSNGTFLLKKLEEYARSVGIEKIKLLDGSLIRTDCLDDFGEEISINLAFLKLLTKGKSWYNSLGYLSSDSNAEEIAALPCEKAILLCKKEKIDTIRKFYSNKLRSLHERLERIKATTLDFETSQIFIDTQYEIENNEVIIESRIDEVKRETRMILNVSRRLFPRVDLEKITVREYLNTILPEKFVKGGNCKEYKFIEDFIDFISTLLNYDEDLTKTLVTGGRKKTRYKKRNNGSRLNAKKSKKKL